MTATPLQSNESVQGPDPDPDNHENLQSCNSGDKFEQFEVYGNITNYMDLDVEDFNNVGDKPIEVESSALPQLLKRKSKSIPLVTVCDDSDEEIEVDRKELKLKSPIWDHYHLTLKKKSKLRVARCNYCKIKVLADTSKNGTSSVRCHFSTCTRNPFNKCAPPNLKQTQLNLQKLGPNQSTNGVTSSSIWRFDFKAVRLALVKWKIMDEDPFSSIEKPGFLHFWSIAFHPQFQPPARTQFTRDCMNLYENMKTSLKSFFSLNKQRVSLTTDTWTSCQRLSYMSLTAHYVDENWKLNKKIISFVPVSSHKGDDLGDMLENCLREWSIKDVFCISVDNASPNDVMVRSLRDNLNRWGGSMLQGKYLHMRCTAHIINLVVSEGLKENLVSVSRVRTACKYIRQGTMRWPKFLEVAALLDITYKKNLWLDSPTRWNGVYIMLERAVHYELAFERYSKVDKQFKADMIDGPGYLEEQDWINVKRLVKFLEPFYNLTKKVSGSWYVTSNVFVREVSDMYAELRELEDNVDDELSVMATRMIEKFEKYWGDPEKMNFNMFFAFVLDPRHRFEDLKFCLENIYGEERGEVYSVMIRNEMDLLYKEYAKTMQPKPKQTTGTQVGGQSNQSGDGSSQDASINATTTKSGKPKPRKMDEHKRLKLSASSSTSDKELTELDKYLSEGLDPNSANFDVLIWWKVHSPRFPVLSAMAKDVLGVPISTVASESAFSTGGRVLSDFRSSLTPKSVQALICAQDWLRPRDGMVGDEEDIDNLDMLEKDSEMNIHCLDDVGK